MSAARPFVHEPAAAFRGTRTYVHSTDLYEQFAAGAAAANLEFKGQIDLRISGRITFRPRYLFAPVSAEPSAHPFATCRFVSRGEPWVSTVEEGTLPIIERQSYDESPVSRCARLGDRIAEIDSETGLRPIEALTALAVVLHKHALPPASSQRWMLARLTLDRALQASDSRQIAIKIERLVGQSMTRSRITGIDGPIGSVMFALDQG